MLTLRQARIRAARRALAAAGYAGGGDLVVHVARGGARLFGGGAEALVLENPIAAELDCMRPSILPSLIEAAGRNAAARLRRRAPCSRSARCSPATEPADQRTAVAADPGAARPAPLGPCGAAEDVFALKGDLMALLDELGAPVANLQTVQDGAAPWWRPGRAARLQLGPKAVLAEFGELHPEVLGGAGRRGPIYAFEVWLEAIPEPKKKAVKTRPALALSPLMPLTPRLRLRGGPRTRAAGDIVRAVPVRRPAADRRRRGCSTSTRAPGVPAGAKSVAVEVTIQPREKTLADAEIEAISAKIVGAAAKATGAVLRA